MRKPTFENAALIQVRVEPELRDAIVRAAKREKTSNAEFLRRALRDFMARRQS